MIVFNKKLFLVLIAPSVLAALFLILIHSYYAKNESNYKEMYEKMLLEQPPDIVGIQFDWKTARRGWVELAYKTKTRIALKEHATLVELYITPVGTATYKERRLIDYAYPKNGTAEYV